MLFKLCLSLDDTLSKLFLIHIPNISLASVKLVSLKLSEKDIAITLEKYLSPLCLNVL